MSLITAHQTNVLEFVPRKRWYHPQQNYETLVIAPIIVNYVQKIFIFFEAPLLLYRILNLVQLFCGNFLVWHWKISSVMINVVGFLQCYFLGQTFALIVCNDFCIQKLLTTLQQTNKQAYILFYDSAILFVQNMANNK